MAVIVSNKGTNPNIEPNMVVLAERTAKAHLLYCPFCKTYHRHKPKKK
jgi:hypothetical protein